MRREAIDTVLLDLDIESLTIEEIQLLAQSYVQPDVEGKYTPFCTVIAYYIKNYF